MRSAPVHFWLPGSPDPTEAGIFEWDGGQGRFRYSGEYLSGLYLHGRSPLPLDPILLPLKRTTINETHQKGIFGVFSDGSADAWGKRLLEAKYGELDAFEVLERSSDDGVGAIAVGELENKKSPAFSLADLRDAATKIAAMQVKDVPNEILGVLHPTTSLGGAKPKLNIRHKGEMWIAKFIERGDSTYLPQAEHALLQLGRQCGIDTCHSVVELVGDDCYAILVKRFDRERVDGGFARRGFASAHTVLRIKPESDLRDKSYIKLSHELQRWVAPTEALQQKRELWRRIVFNALVGNVDDHTKNHGLLQYGNSWRLSPAFDIVPVLHPRRDRIALSMSFAKIEGRMTAIVSSETLLNDCRLFGYEPEEARGELLGMAEIVASDWRASMLKAGMPTEEVERFAESFGVAHRIGREVKADLISMPLSRQSSDFSP